MRIFLTQRSYTTDNIVKRFSEAAKIPASATLLKYESCLEMRLHCDIDLNAIDDELREDIMRTTPGVISEMQAGISNTVPSLTQ